MTISQLIYLLEEQKEYSGDLEVRIAYQPSWPLAANVENVVALESNDDQMMCWIAVDGVGYSENPYAPDACWDRW